MVKKYNALKDIVGEKDDAEDLKRFHKAIGKAVTEPLKKEARAKHNLLDKLKRLRLA